MALNDYSNPSENILFASFEQDISDHNGNEFTVGGEQPQFLQDAIVGNYVEIPGKSYLLIENYELAVGTSDFTLDCWIRTIGDYASVGTMQHRVAGTSLWPTPFEAFAYIGGGSIAHPRIPLEFALGTWNHCAIVRKDGLVSAYVNGQLQGTFQDNTFLNSPNLAVNTFYSDRPTAYLKGENHYKALRFCSFARWTEDFEPPDPLLPGQDDFKITEKYELEDGTELQSAVAKTVPSGDGYAAPAPVIDGYTCIGYKIDGGMLQQGTTATIASVRQNHIVAFIYKQKQQGNCEEGVPAGMVMYFTDITAPDGWLECNGSAVSRTVYQNLFSVVGTKFGAGDGYSTFNLPDLRSEFIRGFDNGRGLDAEREFGSNQKASLQAYDPTKTSIFMIGLYNTENDDSAAFQEKIGVEPVALADYQGVAAAGTDYATSVRDDEQCFGATRPRNVALLPCIKH